jgi:hypothetical protein
VVKILQFLFKPDNFRQNKPLLPYQINLAFPIVEKIGIFSVLLFENRLYPENPFIGKKTKKGMGG